MKTHGSTTFDGRSYEAWTASNGYSVLARYDPVSMTAEVYADPDAAGFVDRLYRLGPDAAGPLTSPLAMVYGPRSHRHRPASVSLHSRSLESGDDTKILMAVVEIADYYRDFMDNRIVHDTPVKAS